jgi:A/G-specific adenine glycosylase
VKTRRVKRGRRQHALLWLIDGERLWLTQRPPKGVWAGLWSLPEFDSLDALQAQLGASPGSGELLPAIEHTLTHFDWTLQPLRWTLPPPVGEGVGKGEAVREGGWPALEEALAPGRWVTRAEALAMGLPAPLRKLLTSA